MKKRAGKLLGFSPAKDGSFVGLRRQVISVCFQRDIARSAKRVKHLRHDKLRACCMSHGYAIGLGLGRGTDWAS